MAKICSFCGQKIGLLGHHLDFEDGLMGEKCLIKYGMGTKHSIVPGAKEYAKCHTVQSFKDLVASGKSFKDIQQNFLTDKEKEKLAKKEKLEAQRKAAQAKREAMLKKYDELLPIFQKEGTAKFSHYIFDDKRRQILKKKTLLSDPELINYSDIISYQPNQYGHDENKHHGITRAVVGGALAGGVGAIVGATTGGKRNDFIDHLGLIITLKDGTNFEIVFIRKIEQLKANSFAARSSIEQFNQLVSIIDAIIAQNQAQQAVAQPTAQSFKQTTKPTAKKESTDPADEIRKFKKLADDGIITQEEFEAKKKQLLGL